MQDLCEAGQKVTPLCPIGDHRPDSRRLLEEFGYNLFLDRPSNLLQSQTSRALHDQHRWAHVGAARVNTGAEPPPDRLDCSPCLGGETTEPGQKAGGF